MNILRVKNKMSKQINPNLRKLAELTCNPNLAMPNLDEKVKQETEQPIQVQANVNLGDYVQIPNLNKIISKFELQGFNNLNYENTHFKLFENGLFMPDPALFMKHFLNIKDAYQGKIKLYDGLGQVLNKKEIEDIYKHLTTDHITIYGQGTEKGAWTWLNSRFVKGKGFSDLDLETITSVDGNGDFNTRREPLMECVQQDCYVNLDFNSQGLAIQGSRKQDYVQGENIHYWYPREGCVAGFVASSGRAYLDCDGDPSDSDASLGVYGCCEAVRAGNLKSS